LVKALASDTGKRIRKQRDQSWADWRKPPVTRAEPQFGACAIRDGKRGHHRPDPGPKKRELPLKGGSGTKPGTLLRQQAGAHLWRWIWGRVREAMPSRVHPQLIRGVIGKRERITLTLSRRLRKNDNCYLEPEELLGRYAGLRRL